MPSQGLKVPREIQIWPIDKLVFYARNPRRNAAAVDRMCGSIRESLTELMLGSPGENLLEYYGGLLAEKAAGDKGSL